MSVKTFLDTNVLIYALAQDGAKTASALSLVESGGTISVQVLNELINALRRRLDRDWDEVERILSAAYSLCAPVQPVTEAIHIRAVAIARRYQYGIYDSTIIASALSAGCTILYSEDMQDGQRIGGLTIRNPFTAPA